MPSTLTFKRDYATTDDQLGFSRYVDTIGEMISDENFETPFCIGIHGKWGSGKTSFMRQLQTFLEKNPTDNPITIPVWFNPWRYTNEDHLIIPFLKTIEAELKRYSEVLGANSKTAKQNIVNRACLAIARTARSIAYASQLNFGVVKFTGKDAVNQEKDLLAAEKDQDFTEEHQELAEIYFTVTQHLQQVVFAESDAKTTADKKPPALRLVIFIDDLDRCLPEKAVELLEAMKLFLDLEGYLFVLGVDRDVVEEGIRTHYKFDENDYSDGNLSKGRSLAEKYLEKMIQMPLELPPLEPTRKRNLIDQLLDKSEGFKQHAKLIQDGIVGRPRDIVRFVNYLAFFGRLAEKLKFDLLTNGTESSAKPENYKDLLDRYFSPEFYLKWAILVHAFRNHHKEILKRTDYFFRLQGQVRSDLQEQREQREKSEVLDIEVPLQKVLAYREPFSPEPWLIHIYVHLADSVSQAVLSQREVERKDSEPDFPMRGRRKELKIPAIGTLVEVSRGPFLFGESKTRENIENDFMIDCFPVINIQFCNFLNIYSGKKLEDENGHQLIYLFPSKIEKVSSGSIWYATKDGYENHPVTGVTYWGAKAYCRWRTQNEGNDVLVFDLPTEFQWEKAARGDGGFEFPWGDVFNKSHCNTSESGNHDTSVVDKYPLGVSPYGCFEMAGNVLEWIESGREDLKYIKGGSWDDDRRYARCSFRDWLPPDDGLSHVGFRCVANFRSKNATNPITA